jgi:hypothetical protein
MLSRCRLPVCSKPRSSFLLLGVFGTGVEAGDGGGVGAALSRHKVILAATVARRRTRWLTFSITPGQARADAQATATIPFRGHPWHDADAAEDGLAHIDAVVMANKCDSDVSAVRAGLRGYDAAHVDAETVCLALRKRRVALNQGLLVLRSGSGLVAHARRMCWRVQNLRGGCR